MPRKDPQKCSKIRDRVDKWNKYWTINRSLYYEWIDFVLGDQWREDESKLFERYNKIPLMMNKLGVLYNHLLGDQIQNTPNLVIAPDEDVPAETAQTRAHLVKNINLNSDTATIFQNAYGQAVIGGFSGFYVGHDYIDEDAFDQEIKLYGFEDPNRCYWDISAKHVCKVDGMYSGFQTRVSRKWFQEKFGKDVESQIGTTSITEDSTMAFADDDSITLVDDFERELKSETIYKMSDPNDRRGVIVNAKQYAEFRKEKINGKRYILNAEGFPITVLDKRETLRSTIRHSQVAGDFVIEDEDFPTKKLLPVIFVDQKSYFSKQGQQITRSFFKDVKDPQKYLNYLATQMAYITKISRYDQFIMPRKCAANPDTQQQWRDPSVVRGALYYDETPSGKEPTQLKPPELSQSLTQQYERTLMDIQSGTGMYNTQMGEQGNEVSGTAVKRRTRRGQTNTQTPRNSVDIAIATSGEVINEMIPVLMGNERTVVLNTPESEEKRITLNKPADEYGLAIENDMTKGKYKIRLKPGPSYEGQKEEALESLQLVLQADKSGQVFPMIADLYAENLPLDNNIELRNRLRTLVPQEIIEAGKTGKPLPPKQPQPSPEQIMAQLKQQELQQKAQQAQVDNQTKMKELELKQAEIQRKAIETHQDMSVEWERLEAEKQESAAELQAAILRYKAESERLQADMEISHSENIIKLLTHAGQLHHEKAMQKTEHEHQIKNKPEPKLKG